MNLKYLYCTLFFAGALHAGIDAYRASEYESASRSGIATQGEKPHQSSLEELLTAGFLLSVGIGTLSKQPKRQTA